MKQLRAAVIGVGYLGSFHAQKYATLPDIDLVVIADSDARRAAEVSASLGGVRHVRDIRDALYGIDIASIVVPPDKHFDLAAICLRAGIHVLVEKPVTTTVDEAQILIDLARARGLVFQVGHLERFNPTVKALLPGVIVPYRIEAQRFAPFKSRGTEVDVVLDLMIHDIDIAVSMVKSGIVDIRATGRTVVTDDIDTATAHLAFSDGCIAHLQADRVSPVAMRRMRVYQQDCVFTADYLDHTLTTERVALDGTRTQTTASCLPGDPVFGTDALLAEIVGFTEAVRRRTLPIVSGEDGKRALEIAIAISHRIKADPVYGSDRVVRLTAASE